MPTRARLENLRQLGRLASKAPPTEESLREAVACVQRALEGREVHLVYAVDDEFRYVSEPATAPEPTTQAGLWIIQRAATECDCAVGFTIEGQFVDNVVAAGDGVERPWLAVPLPAAGYASEMLLVGGFEGACLPDDVAEVLDAAIPALSLVLSRVLDAEKASRQKRELNVLSELAFAITQETDPETILTRLATSVAVVSQHDYAVIDLLKPGTDHEILMRCLNENRFTDTSLARIWREWGGRSGIDPAYRGPTPQREALLYADLQNDPRIAPEMQTFFKQSLLVSAAVLPLFFRDELLGTLSLASYVRRPYPPEQVLTLQGLAAQVTATIKAMHTFAELEESRVKLREYAERLRESMEEQHRLARTDALTGIPNRRYLEEVLEKECARARREGKPLSVALADVDNLKLHNDTRGHRAGDSALAHIAAIARRECRTMDTLGRYGGDEFVFVLPLADLDEAQRFAERVRLAIARENRRSEGGVSVSFGIAQLRESDTPETVLQRADEALYRAKAAGKDTVWREGPLAADDRIVGAAATSPV